MVVAGDQDPKKALPAPIAPHIQAAAKPCKVWDKSETHSSSAIVPERPVGRSRQAEEVL